MPNNYSYEMVRIIREINTFRLSHPNITQFKQSYFTDEDQFVIITELAVSNLQAFRENTDITNDQIVGIMIQLLKGTIHLYNQNVMHRDLSPDNILVYENGEKFKICDFGMAQFESSAKSYVGKPFFKAPEINQDEEFSYSTQVDIWSLGVIPLHQEIPILRQGYIHTQEVTMRIISFNDQLTKSDCKDSTKIIQLEGERKVFESLLNKMLQLNPALRLDSLQVLYELCVLSNEPLNKHLHIEEEKQSHHLPSDDNIKNAFAITIKSANAVVNKIIQKLGDFNYGAIDKIDPNPNRIFLPLIKYDNGDTYQGEYDTVTQKMDGRGRIIFSDGGVYDGLWKNNLKDGYGRQIQNDENYYIGEWKDNELNGYGKYHYNSGSIYEGQWVNNNKEGLGLHKWSDGDQYYGQWVRNKRQGVGVFTFNTGNIEVGQWIDGQQHGVIMLIAKNGEQIQIRKYEKGKLLETLLKTDNVQR